MSFETPITIRTALTRIQKQEFVLPAIQREFVWRPEQISGLFDSLMQGYPIGSFLLWLVEESHSQEYVFYGFLREYHQLKRKHCPRLDLPPQKVTVVLDGQQRLTSLNIGLRGSFADKSPRKWWTSPDAYPVRKLYLNLRSPAPENESGMVYDFRFLTPERAQSEASDQFSWFAVSDLWDCEGPKDVNRILIQAGLAQEEWASGTLFDFWNILNQKALIPYFQETEQNLDKVLNIFIRVNSAGTPLSYSDLLLSIATAQWRDLDAREAIHGLVDELNEVGGGFQISKDLVLKAGLLLSDISSVGFRVTNFNVGNMTTLEGTWTDVSRALRMTVRLVASFGFSRHNLAADSAFLPIAYYLYHKNPGESYLTSVQYRSDREKIRGWLCRSLVKSGIWGSGLDTTLLAIRSAIQAAGHDSFPDAEIEAAMARRGKSLRFTDEELEDLLETPYGHGRVFALLSLLYPDVSLGQELHVDHVFPRTCVTPGKLRQLGFDTTTVDLLRDRSERLPNLQLLGASENQSKLGRLPAAWLQERFPDAEALSNYVGVQDLSGVPTDLRDFLEFYEARRGRMLLRIQRVLGLGSSPVGDASPLPVPVATPSRPPQSTPLPATASATVAPASPSANLCRGWTAETLTAAVERATPLQRRILRAIASHPEGVTIGRVAEHAGASGKRGVGGALATWSQNVTRRIGVTDPATGRPSWPIEFLGPAPDGTADWQYYMPPAAAELVLMLTEQD